MKATEDTAGDNMAFENESANIMNALVQEAEQIIAKACDEAKQEVEQEMERALREYEQKTRQIMLKIKEEAKLRTMGIANRLGEAIMLSIEKSSTEAIAEAITEFNKKAGNLTQTLQDTAKQETEKALAGISFGAGDSAQNAADNVTPKNKSEAEKGKEEDVAQKQPESDKTTGEAKQGFKIEVEQEIESFIQNEANGGSKQTSKEFEQWLTQ
jgi:hypothetical protein